MGGIRGNQQAVPVFQLIAFITDVVFHIAFQEKIELAVVMFMGIDGFKRGIIIIEEFKVSGLHVLPCVKVHGQLFFHGSPSSRET